MEIIDFSEFRKEFWPKVAAITCQECGAVIMGGKRYVERYCMQNLIGQNVYVQVVLKIG